jgi:methionyl-tRNA synthetase
MLKVVDRMLDWENAASMKLVKTGYSLREPELLFGKIDDDQVNAQLAKLDAGAQLKATKTEGQDALKSQKAADNQKAEISFEDFAKIDLRVGKVIAAEKVEKADKLLKLTIDIGAEQRTVVSGIAQQYKPEELTGKLVTLVANLKPRKMRGIESQGMILMAEDNGRLVFVGTPEDTTPGSTVS